jgi:hypothetical protein
MISTLFKFVLLVLFSPIILVVGLFVLAGLAASFVVATGISLFIISILYHVIIGILL